MAAKLPVMNDIDFAHSYVRFSTQRVLHTPRMRLAAVCSFVPEGGEARSYFMSCECICENMYLREGLVQSPVGEFVIIVRPGVEFAMIKRHASASDDVRSDRRVGEVMPTRDGKGAVMSLVDAHTRSMRVEPVKTYEAFRDALLADRTMNCRTTCFDADQKTRIVLDYPATTVNVSHDKPAWQVDAGPMLFPARAVSGGLEVDRLDLAHIVFNRFDYAELAVAGNVPVQGGGATKHFAGGVAIQCTHEIFAEA